MDNGSRVSYDDFLKLCNVHNHPFAKCLHRGDAISVDDALSLLDEFSTHHSEDVLEGVVFRVETKKKFNFLAKYVRHEKVDGQYLVGVDNAINHSDIWNWRAE